MTPKGSFSWGSSLTAPPCQLVGTSENAGLSELRVLDKPGQAGHVLGTP